MVDSAVDCLLVDGVLCGEPDVRACSSRSLPAVCFSCVHFFDFERSMRDEEERFFDECDEIRRTGVWKLSGSRGGK